MGTIPNLSTPELLGLFPGKTRRALLALFFMHPDEWFYLRQVVRLVGTGLGAVQRGLADLVHAGILVKMARGNQVCFQVNRSSPVHAELRGLVLKTAGAADVLHAAMEPLRKQVALAFVFGSVARGEHSQRSDIDLFVVGDVSLKDVVKALRPAEEQLAREVNPVLFPPEEFRRAIHSGNSFLAEVVSGPKLWVLGTADELEAMADQRVAAGAQAVAKGDSRSAGRRRPRHVQL
ncbi:MAG TPA: nucleotidyltransferase domain-containing protein [Candidatus Acidoferrales bacterium]